MSIFSRSKPEANQERHSYAVLDLAERMDRLERQMRDLTTDWNAQYDKFHRLNMRLAKRQKAIEEHEDAETRETAPENGSRATNSAPPDMNPLAAALLLRGRTR